MRKLAFVLGLIITLHTAIFAQNVDSLKLNYNYFSQYLSPEKLYLHIDRNIFAPGETIWFKGYLENKSYHSVMPTSNFAYVELLCDTVISRIMLKKVDEGFEGHLPLPDGIIPGEYILRAYTNWNKNMPAEYMFYSKIRIVDSNNPSEKEPVSKKDDLKIDFYPESGRYFAGMMATIAFKTNYNNIKGYIRNSKGDKVTDFCTEHDGMGRIIFFPVEGERYYAKVSSGEYSDKIYELPEPSADGGMINIKSNQDAFIIQSYVSHRAASLVLHNGSEIYYCEPVNQVSSIIRVDKRNLSRGINHALLISPNGEILAERLFFVYDKEGVRTNFKFNKDIYGRREKVTVSATIKDLNGDPLAGEFSVSVLDGNFQDFSQEENIDSYMMISSELKGKISNPDYYFDNSVPLNERQRAADLLMMVQGWRYYDVLYLFSHHPQVKYGKEFTQSISGSVKTMMGRKTNGSSIIMFSPEIGLSYKKDFGGSDFYIDSLDFPDGTPFFLLANEQVGKKNLTANIENDVFAPCFKYAQFYCIPAISISEEGIGTGSGIRKLNVFPISNNDSIKIIKLKEAVVTASAYYMPKHNPSPYGQSFERWNVKEREELERDDSKEVQDYLVQNYPSFFKMDDQIYSRRIGSIQQITQPTGEQETIITNNEPILYVDGVRWSTKDLRGMNVRDIETLIVLKGNDGVLYKSVWGVILISTRRGDSETDKQNIKSKGVVINPLGWQKPTRFYSPVYDTPEMYNASKPDYRTTVYWNPSIKTDEKGFVTIEFYTSDYKKPCIIRIEGRTSDNRYISKTTYLQVE